MSDVYYHYQINYIDNFILVLYIENSWPLFRGNEGRTGFFPGRLSRELSLMWVIDLESMISSPIFHDNIIYNSTITGKIFAVNVYKKKIIWQKDTETPFVSSLLLHENLLISCTFNSWIIKQESKTLEKNLIYALDITKEG